MKIKPNQQDKYQVKVSIFPAFIEIIANNLSLKRATEIADKNNATCDTWEHYWIEPDENKTQST